MDYGIVLLVVEMGGKYHTFVKQVTGFKKIKYGNIFVLSFVYK